MRKWLSFFLCCTLLLPVGIPALPGAAAEAPAPSKTPALPAAQTGSAFAEGENSLIVFVTGIGQSFSYLFSDEYLAPGAFAHGTLQDYKNYAPLIAQGKYESSWNLFANNIGDTIKEKASLKIVARLIGQLICTLFLRRNLVKESDLRALVRQLFKSNLIDEAGRVDPHLVTPRYTMPLADYPGVIQADGTWYSEAKHRFYTSIPCAETAREKLGDRFEEYLYCFNYRPFSFTSENVSALHDLLKRRLPKTVWGRIRWCWSP